MTTVAYMVAGHCNLNKVRIDGMPKIGTYADVEVGITTGSNGYFTVPQGVVDIPHR